MSDTSFFFLILVSWYNMVKVEPPYWNILWLVSKSVLIYKKSNKRIKWNWWVVCAVLFLGLFFFFNRLTSLKCQLQNNSVKNITHTKNYWVVFFVCATSLDIYMFHALAIALTLTFHLSISCWPHSYPLIQFETDKTGDQVSCVLYKIKWVTTCT